MGWTFFNLRPAYTASSKLTNVKKPGKNPKSQLKRICLLISQEPWVIYFKNALAKNCFQSLLKFKSLKRVIEYE